MRRPSPRRRTGASGSRPKPVKARHSACCCRSPQTDRARRTDHESPASDGQRIHHRGDLAPACHRGHLALPGGDVRTLPAAHTLTSPHDLCCGIRFAASLSHPSACPAHRHADLLPDCHPRARPTRLLQHPCRLDRHHGQCERHAVFHRRTLQDHSR
ncbi:MAG: hypothetical protein MZV64_59815 [Ignavibacteriales bacterium]|nr:hypothetical protein [Ignavibacteriales bacterium]